MSRTSTLAARLRTLAVRLRHPATAFAALFVLLAAVLALGLGDDEEGESAGRPLPPLTGAFIDPKLGVRVAYPEDWSAERESRGESQAVALRANDGSAVVTVSPVARSKLAEDVLDAAVDQIRAEYRRVERLGSQDLEIAGQPGEARLFLGTNREDQRLRILIATVEGDRKAYLLNVFSRVQADQRIAQIEQILTSLQLLK